MSKKYKPNHVKRYMNYMADIGCVICATPAQLHHIRIHASKRDDMLIIPLCMEHHNELHRSKNLFEIKYGAQLTLFSKALDQVLRKLR